MNIEDRKTLFALDSERIALDLVTLSFQEKDATQESTRYIRLCNHPEGVEIRGEYYTGCGVDVTKPNKSIEPTEPNSTLRLSGIGNSYIQLVQSLSPDTEITMVTETVFLDNPEEVLDGPYTLKVTGITLQSSTGTIEISCTGSKLLDYIASSLSYTPKDFPAIWT